LLAPVWSGDESISKQQCKRFKYNNFVTSSNWMMIEDAEAMGFSLVKSFDLSANAGWTSRAATRASTTHVTSKYIIKSTCKSKNTALEVKMILMKIEHCIG